MSRAFCPALGRLPGQPALQAAQWAAVPRCPAYGLDQVSAAMEDGVLTVTVPKEQAKKPQVKTVEISG